MSDTELIRYGYSRIPGQSMAPASGMQTSGELISGRVITFQLRKNQ